MTANVLTEILVLQEITKAVVRERNVRLLLEEVLEILSRRMNMVRGTFALLEGDELRIEASARMLNAEERVLGRYHIGEGITGLVAKTGKSEVVPDVRKDKRFLNKTRSRSLKEQISFICVPLIQLGRWWAPCLWPVRYTPLRPLLQGMWHFWRLSPTSLRRLRRYFTRNVRRRRPCRMRTGICAA